MQYKCQIYRSGVLNVSHNLVNCFIALQFTIGFGPIFKTTIPFKIHIIKF